MHLLCFPAVGIRSKKVIMSQLSSCAANWALLFLRPKSSVWSGLLPLLVVVNQVGPREGRYLKASAHSITVHHEQLPVHLFDCSARFRYFVIICPFRDQLGLSLSPVLRVSLFSFEPSGFMAIKNISAAISSSRRCSHQK